MARMNTHDKAPPTELKPSNAVWEVAKFFVICLFGFAAVSVLIGIGLIVVMGLTIAAM
jgi:nitrate reductase NapE component